MSTNRKAPPSVLTSITSACALAVALAGCDGEQDNRAPTAAAASLVGDEDTDIVGRLSGGDRDGDPLTFNVVRLPDHGTLSTDTGGSFKYTPRANFHGRDSFEFSASDGKATSATATISIDVTAVNSAPSIQAPASLALIEDSTATAAFTITDPDGEAAALIMRRPPAYGAVSLAAPNTLEYRPRENFHGQDSFEISATDGQAEAAPIVITVTVAPVNDAPVIAALPSLALNEDSAATVAFAIADVDAEAAALIMRRPPAHGAVSLVAPNTLEYRPQPNFNGQDTFEISASDGRAEATAILVTAKVDPVNDPLVLGFMPDATNSAETFRTPLTLPLEDVDGDLASVTATSDRSDIATVLYDASAKQLVLTPLEYGLARITVTATDGTPVSRTFDFSVQDVTKARTLPNEAGQVSQGAISVRNDSDRVVDFRLQHNGAPVFESTAQMVQFVRDMPAELPEEPFERKLWRFIRDSTNHYYPLMPLQFKEAPWGTMNSTGFGFCADMATSYVAIAKAAGYEARVWSLNDHVVPEIKVGGRWQVYDPDLGIYYFNRDGSVAGVEQLGADPQLVRAPTRPILPIDSFPYSQIVTDIYATTSNNILADAVLLPAVKDVAGRFILPPGASLTYPGRWTDVPIAYEVFGSLTRESDLPAWRSIAASQGTDTPLPIPFHRQAKIDLADGWTGRLALPLWLWEVQGSGSVRIDEIDYEIGSSELAERLQHRVAVRELEITRGSNVSLIMQINFVMFYMLESSSIELTGRDVWALTPASLDIGANGAGAKWNAGRQKAIP